MQQDGQESVRWWADYDARAYDALPEFEPDEGALAALRPAIARSGAIIRHYACEGVLGLCLLHRHFPLAADERLVRRVTAPHRGQARPVPAASAGTCLPWVFAFAPEKPGENGATWHPVEWVETAACPPGAMEVLSRLGPVAEAVADTLREARAERSLGLACLYAFCGLEIAPDEELAETTDDAGRELNLAVVPRASRSRSAVQTLWRFPPAA